MISRYTYDHLQWIDLESPTHEEVRMLMEEFDIHPVVADELLTPSLRPKVDHHENLIYLILHFPAIRHTHASEPIQEIDFVIGKNFLITVHYEAIDPLHKFSKVFEVNSILDKSQIGDHAGFLFFYMIRKVYASLNHEIAIINDALKDAEKKIFGGEERRMVEELSMINRDLLSLDRALRLHDRVLTSLKVATHQFFGPDFDHYVDNIIGEYHKINALLEDQKDTMKDLRETNDSLLSTKTNEVIKILTAITFITFPSSFLSWIFAVDAEHKPISGMPYDFWIFVALMAFSSWITYLYLRAKKWI